jgi:Domain of unknown function (DUF4129)
MQPAEPSTGRSIRLALVAFSLLGLLAIVAFASKSGIGHSSHTSPTPGYVNYAFTAFLIVFVLAIPVAAYAFLLQARERAFDKRKTFAVRVLQNIIVFLWILGIVALVLYLKRHHSHLFQRATLHNPGKIVDKHHPNNPSLKYEPRFEWTVFWIALAAFIVAAVVLFDQRRRRLLRRRRAVPLETTTVADELAAEMTDAIDDLEAEPDARRAVIAAYARMESVLARHGLRRRPSETPLEYLRRILLGLTARVEAVTRLTDLFEQAKFSRHEIDATMKRDAIGALREIRDDLLGATA